MLSIIVKLHYDSVSMHYHCLILYYRYWLDVSNRNALQGLCLNRACGWASACCFSMCLHAIRVFQCSQRGAATQKLQTSVRSNSIYLCVYSIRVSQHFSLLPWKAFNAISATSVVLWENKFSHFTVQLSAVYNRCISYLLNVLWLKLWK